VVSVSWIFFSVPPVFLHCLNPVIVRLRSCVAILLDLPAGTEAVQVFGKVDAMKLRSCMTLFENVSYEDEPIVEVIERYFSGERCPLTLEIIRKSGPARRMLFSR
jgi:uncharacterized protein (DUF1810 family)